MGVDRSLKSDELGRGGDEESVGLAGGEARKVKQEEEEEG